MANDELKKQIIGILLPIIKSDKISCNEENACERCWFPCEINRETDKLADALIAAGLRFGENLTATFDRMALEREHDLERRLAEAEHRAEVAELVVKNLNDIFTFDYQTVFEQAEKELEEEKNDD